MFRSRIRRSALDRRGVSLMVVLALLTLFAIVGLSFAMYGSSAATSSRISREAENKSTTDLPDAAEAASLAIQQILFPANDNDPNGLMSALRGHSLAEGIYGYNRAVANDVAYNGVGPFQESLAMPLYGVPTIPRSQVVNFSLVRNGANYAIVDAEYTRGGTVREGPNPFALPAIGTGSVYVGKNANYTYVDRNNMLIAMVNPTTGEVVVPSAHRNTLFNASLATTKMGLAPPGINGLPPASDDWLTPDGRFRILRPRPADHVFNGTSEFPYPPPNPDGTYTGDVQNQRYTDGRQRNDSVWLDLGAPVMTWRGRQIKPLFAPLIVPLDGRVNVNVAGNTSNPGGAHVSNQGWGPWEINLSKLLTSANAANVVNTRHGAILSPRGTTITHNYFNPVTTQQPYLRSAIDWGGAGTAFRMALPTAFASDPVWASNPIGPHDNSDMTLEAASHPSLHNPYQRDPFPVGSALVGPGTYPLTDFKQFARYSGRQGLYNTTALGQSASSDLTYTGPLNPADPLTFANLRRSLLTPISNSRKVHNLAPNFLTDPLQPAAITLVMDGVTVPVPILARRTTPTMQQTPTLDFTTLANNTDGTATAVRNIRAGLPAVNLNRALADYRLDTTQPLSPTNVANATNAVGERRLLAQDIFNRLAIVTGARVDYNATTGVVTVPMFTPPNIYMLGLNPVSPEEYNALRWLAQLAVNIVDYLDNDDISTPFVWNAITGTLPDDPLNFAATDIGGRVVFGTEKPRLVINEVYAEAATHRMDIGSNNATRSPQVRFFVELLHAGNSDNTTGALAIPTNVPLRYPAGAGATTSCYVVEVHTNGTNVRTELAAPGNVTGLVAGPRTTATFTGALSANAVAALADTVEPNAGTYAAAAGARNGIAVVGPNLTFNAADMTSYAPDTSAGVPSTMIQTAAGADLQYNLSMAGGMNQADYGTAYAALVRHGVVLRRLANPYDPLGSTNPANPYITVDYASQVHVNDAVSVYASTTNMGTRNPLPMRQDQYGTGRVQPHAAGTELVDPNGATYNTALTLRQQNTDQPTMQQHTLFRHNGLTDTQPAVADAKVRTPFGWLTHLDRAVVNQMELLHVSVVPTHQLTHLFATPTAADPDVQTHEFSRIVNNPALTNAPWHRALESLSVKSWTHGLPDGGRVPGKVNINMIWDPANNPRILQAILDGQMAPGASNYLLDTDVLASWNALLTRRTPTFPDVGVTADEDPAAATPDRPIKGLGQPTFGVNANLPLGTGVNDTLLTTLTTILTGPLSLSTQGHPYLRNEPLRKAYNNLTTTSDTFELKMTVGWFEVRNPAPHDLTNPPILGKEVFDKVPGDMRAQFDAVLDRTNLATDLDPLSPPNTQAPAMRLWETELVKSPSPTDNPGEIYIQFLATGGDDNTIEFHYEGQRIAFPGTARFRLGTGLNAETVQFTSTRALVGGTNLPAFNPATGIATLKIAAAANSHPVGEAVTGNVKFGSPGPQPTFDVRTLQSRGVVRYWTQLTP